MVLEVDLNDPLHNDNATVDSGNNYVNSCLDDDVVITSPRSFAEARRRSRRNAISNQVIITVDEHISDNEEGPSLTLGNNINLNEKPDRRYRTKLEPSKYIDLDQEDHNIEPSEPTFTCSICMGKLVEEVSTICGHIFCRECIRTAIAAQKKCPTCRRRLNPRNVHRIYLPPIG